VKNEDRYGKVTYPLFYCSFQNPNEMIIFLPNIPHMGVNMGNGLNEAIAMYYGTEFQKENKYSCQHSDYVDIKDEDLEYAVNQYKLFWYGKDDTTIIKRDNKCREKKYFSQVSKNRFHCECGQFSRLQNDLSKIREHVSQCKKEGGYSYYNSIELKKGENKRKRDSDTTTTTEPEEEQPIVPASTIREIKDLDKNFFRRIPDEEVEELVPKKRRLI
jgi:hypothetical protein